MDTRSANSREAWSRFARKLKFDRRSLMIFNGVKYKQAKDSPTIIMLFDQARLFRVNINLLQVLKK